MKCTLCDGHGVLATFAQGCCIGAPCPECDPIVLTSPGWQIVYSRETKKVHNIGSGVVSPVPGWVMIGEEDA